MWLGRAKRTICVGKMPRKSLTSCATRSTAPRRLMPNLQASSSPILAFGPHPDDIEFACGGVIAKATAAGQPAHFVICSRGESGTYGTPELRVEESKKAAEILRATVEFIEFDGDAHLEIRSAHSLKLAAVLRRVRPGIVLAP